MGYRISGFPGIVRDTVAYGLCVSGILFFHGQMIGENILHQQAVPKQENQSERGGNAPLRQGYRFNGEKRDDPKRKNC